MVQIAKDNCKEWVKYPQPGEKYLHYKGGRYEIISMGKDHNDETVVIYRSLLFGSVHTRPLSQWFELLITQPKNSQRNVTVTRYERIFEK